MHYMIAVGKDPTITMFAAAEVLSPRFHYPFSLFLFFLFFLLSFFLLRLLFHIVPISLSPQQDGSTLSAAVALASTVTTKLTSAVVSFAKNWWGGGGGGNTVTNSNNNNGNSGSANNAQTSEQQEKKETQKVNPLTCKFYLNDQQRTISSVVLDPTGRLAAATDHYGRVLLLDTYEGVVVRMWKGGYRDAQCGWLQYAQFGMSLQVFLF
jgi:hypothetical protein